jgi:NitT/TauT family transport system ATP-binding protein
MGFYPKHSTGRIDIDDQEIDLAHWSNPDSFFGLVPQTPMLLPWKSVTENILLPLQTPSTSQHSNELVENLLMTVELSHVKDQLPETLSQGMAARVSFARTLITNPKCLLLDEPFAAIDALTRLKLQKWYKTYLSQSSSSACFVTHDIHEALELGDDVIVLGGNPSRIVFKKSRDNFTKLDLEAALGLR